MEARHPWCRRPAGAEGAGFQRRRTFRVHDPFDLGADTAFDARRRQKREEARRNRIEPKAVAAENQALKILNLAQPFTLEALTRRYKALAKKHHPDANGGSADAETRMKLINAAYRTLKAALVGAH